MKIALQTFGTRGDVQPFLALALELKARGHDVVLSVPKDFTDWVEGFGIEARAFDLHMGDFLRRAEELGLTRNPLKAYKYRDEMLTPMIEAVLTEGIEGTRGADIVIAHPKALFAESGAEREGALFMIAAPLPIIMPTGRFPMAGVLAKDHGRFINRLTWFPLKLGMAPYKKRLNRARREIGLEPAGSAIDYGTYMGQPATRLLSISEHVIDRPDDWDARSIMTGYWRLPSSEERPAPEIEAFLNQGEPPVYIGFGSMLAPNATKLVREAVKGLKKAGLRGIIARGWAQLPDQAGDHVLFIDGAPHDRLFPRCRAIVHHGGAGTTAAALHAGRPSLVIPFMMDQPWWAERLRETGLSPPPLLPKRLTAGRFARALRRLVRGEAYARRCQDIARELASENGVGRAADIIESEAEFWHRSRSEKN